MIDGETEFVCLWMGLSAFIYCLVLAYQTNPFIVVTVMLATLTLTHCVDVVK